MNAPYTRIAGLGLIATLAMTSACGPSASDNAAAPVQNVATPAAAPVPAPAVRTVAKGDATAGKKSFGQCMACHSAVKTVDNPLGPNLAGIVGQKAGTHSPAFAYSDALKASDLTWDPSTLDAWITDPLKTVPGTNMHFLGIPRKQTRENIIAYLETTAG